MLLEFLRKRRLNWGKLANAALRKVFTEHEIMTRASAIAFDGILAFIPVVTLFATIAAKLLPSLANPTAQGCVITAHEVLHFLQSVFPSAVAKMIQDQIIFVQSLPSLAVLTVVVCLATYFGSGLFAEIINAINHIYGLDEKRSLLKVRLVTLELIGVHTVTILVAFILIITGPWVYHWFGARDWVGECINWFAVFCMVLLGYGLTFKMAPSERKSFSLCSPGAVFGTVLFMAAGGCFRLWVSHVAHYQILYGSLGSIMMLLVWSYLMSMVFLISAEMNKLAQYAVELDSGKRSMSELDC
jgi:membrane protein